jgi:hypothetical protein
VRRHPVDVPVNEPRGVARLHCGDTRVPHADREANLRRAIGGIAGCISARIAQLRLSVGGRVKSIDELTQMTYAWRLTFRARRCVMQWALLAIPAMRLT